jgi:hypothetical protein
MGNRRKSQGLEHHMPLWAPMGCNQLSFFRVLAMEGVSKSLGQDGVVIEQSSLK